MPSREDMIAEIMDLVRQDPLADITPQIFDACDDGRIHGALMYLRVHRGDGRMIREQITEGDLATVTDLTEDGVVDFAPEDIATAVRAWGGI